MTENLLRNWEIEHFRTIGRELREAGIEFTRKNIERVLNETSFTTRSKKHPKECPYYQMQEGMLKSCHPKIEADNFSCFLCSCPNYDSSSDQGKCRINSPQGKYFPVNWNSSGKVWDCSDCTNFHSTNQVRSYIESKFKEIKASLQS